MPIVLEVQLIRPLLSASPQYRNINRLPFRYTVHEGTFTELTYRFGSTSIQIIRSFEF